MNFQTNLYLDLEMLMFQRENKIKIEIGWNFKRNTEGKIPISSGIQPITPELFIIICIYNLSLSIISYSIEVIHSVLAFLHDGKYIV
jgi:hypothetical protein